MATVNVYLAFGGNCEKAFTFYKSVFGGDFNYIGRYRDMPEHASIPDSRLDWVMHVGLPVSSETMLMGCDMMDECIQGNNYSICIDPGNEHEARRIFNALAEGGTVTMPLDKTFWGSLCGMVTDSFGIHWIVELALKQ